MARLACACALGAALLSLMVAPVAAQTTTSPSTTMPATPTTPSDATGTTGTTGTDTTGTNATTSTTTNSAPPGTGVEQVFELTQVVPPAGAGVSAFTVPTGSHLVVTDVLITNTAMTASCAAGIARADTEPVTGVLCVPATTSLELPLMTGIDFTEGQTVQLLNATSDGTPGTTPLSFHLRGVLLSGDAGAPTVR